MGDRFLIIDDDVRLAGMVRDYLGRGGDVVEARANGTAGMEAVRAAARRGQPFDVVILDLMLPDIDGLEVCRRLRVQGEAAILMLTARGEETDRIVGLELGADDYLPKPFNPRELQARLKAILRRRAGGHGAAERELRFGRLRIDPGSRRASIDGDDRPMTAHQFDLLLALARHAGQVLSRDRLLDLVKGEALEAFDRSIDVHVSRLRAALEDDPSRPRRILTVRGAGYVFARSQDET